MAQLMENSVYSHNVTSLLNHYGFESDDQSIEELVQLWEQHYPLPWVRLAAIEALYQGRYKVISVAQILARWQRRGHAIYHFNHDFERLISRKVPQNIQTYCFATSESPHPFLPSSGSTTASNWLRVSLENSYPTAPHSQTTLLPEASEDTSQYISDYIDEVTPPLLDSQASLVRLPASLPTEPENLEDFHKSSIDRFTPTPDRSDVYLKLMALSTDSNS
jgi:hypothetical protein